MGTSFVYYILVGGFKHGFYFPFHTWDIVGFDKLIFFRRVGQPPTSVLREGFFIAAPKNIPKIPPNISNLIHLQGDGSPSASCFYGHRTT